MRPTPPEWADALLRLFLKPADVDSVSGDLLEEYRDTIYPVRGQSAADTWYVGQVLGFVVRHTRVWAVLFGATFIARGALDLFAPPTDFFVRSTVSTFAGIGLLVATGLWASLRSRSAFAGTCAGVATTAIGALVSAIGAAGLLAIWHDPATLATIRATGGFAEMFAFPVVLILPGAVLGSIGGMVGAAITRWRST
jgi:pheromone shutdown protein TraB